MFDNIGLGEILLILFVALLLFGADRIPKVAKGLGESIKEFKKALYSADPSPTAPSQPIQASSQPAVASLPTSTAVKSVRKPRRKTTRSRKSKTT
jgi:sec-independent protein translocase protein TatA